MKIRTIAMATAALSLVATPVLAEGSLSRSIAPIEGESEAAGSSGWLLGALAVAAVVGGIIAVSSDDDDDLPVSA